MMAQVLEVIGVAGMGMILLAYFLLQRGVVRGHDLRYLLLNLGGSLGMLASVITAWNLPTFLLQLVWIGISLYGIARWWKGRGAQASQD